ncbi:MAG: hydrogenase maturation protease [Hyphomicrobiaceae bacterium]
MVVSIVADLMLAVIGCGNPNRTDDGVGPEVIARLRQRPLPEDVAVYDAGTDGMAVLYRARGLSKLILVDAKSPEDSPGAIFEVPGELLEAPHTPSLNLHDFRWDNALHAARQIYGQEFPGDVVVLLIEAQSLELGLGLTPPVAKAADTAARRIEQLAIEFAKNTDAKR